MKAVNDFLSNIPSSTRHEAAIQKFSETLPPIEAYLETLELMDSNWQRDLESDFLGRRAVVHRPVVEKRATVETEEPISDCGNRDDDFENDDVWGASDWADFLGCNEGSVDDFFENQLC